MHGQSSRYLRYYVVQKKNTWLTAAVSPKNQPKNKGKCEVSSAMLKHQLEQGWEISKKDYCKVVMPAKREKCDSCSVTCSSLGTSDYSLIRLDCRVMIQPEVKVPTLVTKYLKAYIKLHSNVIILFWFLCF